MDGMLWKKGVGTMLKEKSLLLLVLVVVSEVLGFLWLNKRYALVNRHKPIQLSEDEKMLAFMDVASDLGLQ